MKWVKRGLIYNFAQNSDWAYQYARVPVPELLEDRIRFYLTVQDKQEVGRATYIEVDINDFRHVLNVCSNPLFEVGQPGTFDENGCMPISLVSLPNGIKYLYYVGFELGTKIRYRLLSGVAIAKDGMHFQRRGNVPLLERSESELFFRGGPFVIYENGKFRMWYVAGSRWILIDNKNLPVYTINYLESKDGLTWGSKGKVCIDLQYDNEHGFGRPYVIKSNGYYKMFYSKRIKHLGYRLGYAESVDGIEWVRKDEELNLDVSSSGWDSETIAYPAVSQINGKYYMFYNGNGMGKTGFGYAELESW